jgi:hypothetical protein
VIQQEDLPIYKKKRAVYVKHSVAFVVAWIKDYLATLQTQNHNVVPNLE